MPSKPENEFIRSVHKHFGLDRPYFEKQYNPFRSGAADVWYSGTEADMWVEYKFISKIPTARSKVKEIIPDLSPRQFCWLTNRCSEGRNVCVIVGCKLGGTIFGPEHWKTGMSVLQFLSKLCSREELAFFISQYVGLGKFDG